MIITRTYLPRRTVLRGLGATIALPLLDAMVPALTAMSRTSARPARRLSAIYMGMGMSMAQWTPAAEGPLIPSLILRPLDPFKERVLILSGLDNTQGDGIDGGQHPRMQTSWLTGARAKRTEATDLHAGISMDQIVARQFQNDTQLASLELAMESTDLVGICAQGYSCAYNNTITWRNDTTPLPMENNPRAVFQRLFGASDSTDSRTRLADIQKDRSILDSVTDKVSHLGQRLGQHDQTKLAQYLDSLRDVERRIQKAEEQVGLELPVVERPAGIPGTFQEHAKLMYDLLVLAYQCDLTRVTTFLKVREASVRSYPEIGVSDSHHPLSHHQNDPEKLARLARINVFQLHLLAYFLEKLKSVPDGDGSLLDHTLVVCGSGMSDSNLHLHKNVPTILIGDTAQFRITGGRHVRYAPGTPLANLHLTVLERMGVPVERFGDSNGELNLLSQL